MVDVQFSKEEVNALVQLLDIAVKSGGLNVAEAALVIIRKVSTAAQEVKELPAE